MIIKNLSNSYYPIQKACDSNCHTLKANLPPETDIKNNDNNKITFESPDSNQSTENEINSNHNIEDDSKKIAKLHNTR